MKLLMDGVRIDDMAIININCKSAKVHRRYDDRFRSLIGVGIAFELKRFI